MCVKMFIVGDFCPFNEHLDDSLLSESSVFGVQLRKVISNADISILNLETPLTNSSSKLNKTGPCIKSDPQWAGLVNEVGFTGATLANNHIMDYGKDGLDDTITALRNNSIEFVGAGTALEQASKPLIFERNNMRIGFLNFADREYSIAGKESPGANPIDAIQNYYSIKKCRGQLDYLFVIVHGGHEYIEYPSKSFRDLLRFYADCGASAVVAHHSHVVSGYEVYHNVPIFYSLGNFYFAWDSKKPESWYRGLGVVFTLMEGNVCFNVIPICSDSSGKSVEIASDAVARSISDSINIINETIANDDLLTSWWDKYYENNPYNRLFEFFGIKRVGRVIISRTRWAHKYLFSEKRLKRLYHLLNCDSYRDHMIQVLKRRLGYN